MMKQDKIPSNGVNSHNTKTLTGVYYAKESNLSTINGSKAFNYGNDSARLAEATDMRIKRRVYMLIKSNNEMPSPLQGSGDHAYIAEINGIYDPANATSQQRDEIKSLMEDNSANEFESAILDSGYYGYVTEGIIVCLDMNVKVKYLGNINEIGHQVISADPPELSVPKTSRKLPVSGLTRKLTKKDADKLSSILPAIQKKVPSASISEGNLTIAEHEYPTFIKEASDFPDMPKFISSESKKLGLKKEDDYSPKDKQEVLKSIESKLTSNKFTDEVSGKISTALKSFTNESKAFHETEKHDDEMTDLLAEIKNILKVIQNGEEKDREKGTERLQTIIEKTKELSPEAHKFFEKSFNEILTTLNESPQAKQTGPRIVPLDKHTEAFDKSTSVEAFSKAKIKPIVKAIKEPEVEAKQIGPRIVPLDKKNTTEPKNVYTSEEFYKPRASFTKKRIEEPEFTRPVGRPKKHPLDRPIYHKSYSTTDENGNVTTHPEYMEAPEELSGTDKLLGAFLNRNKNIVTRDKNGKIISKRPGANKIGYGREILQTGDEYLGRGSTAKLLRMFKPKSITTPIAPQQPVPPSIRPMDRIEPTMESMESPAVEAAEQGNGLAELAASVAGGAAGGKLLGKFGKYGAALGKYGKMGGRLLGKAAIPLAVGMSAYDAYSGYGEAKENLGIEGREATTGEKLASGLGSLGSGLTLGLLDKKKASRGVANFLGVGKEHQFAAPWDGISPTMQEVDAMGNPTGGIVDSGTGSTTINTNVNNNTAPSTTILPTNPMSIRPMLTSFQKFNDRRYN